MESVTMQGCSCPLTTKNSVHGTEQQRQARRDQENAEHAEFCLDLAHGEPGDRQVDAAEQDDHGHAGRHPLLPTGPVLRGFGGCYFADMLVISGGARQAFACANSPCY